MKLLEADVTKQAVDFLAWRGWRMVRQQSAMVQGPTTMFRVGEPGMADWQAIRYLENGVALVIWLELKSPGDREVCRCARKKRGLCRLCAQRTWREAEERRGAVVVRVDDLAKFERWYETGYAWLHGPDGAPGQMRMPLATEVRG